MVLCNTGFLTSAAAKAVLAVTTVSRAQVVIDMPAPPMPPLHVLEPQSVPDPGPLAVSRYVVERERPVLHRATSQRVVNRHYYHGPHIFSHRHGWPVVVIPTRVTFSHTDGKVPIYPRFERPNRHRFHHHDGAVLMRRTPQR